jgi:7-cyano-7-deazaguanine synthase
MKFEDLQFPNVKKVALSLSGGLDSTTLLYCLVKKYGADNVYALSFYYKQKQSLELDMAKKSCELLGVNHSVIDISFLGDMASKISSNIQGSDISTPTIQEVIGDPQPSTYIPFRNLMFTSMLLSFAESNQCEAVALGIQSVDLYNYWDTTEAFVSCMQALCDLNRKTQIQICTPFVTLTKEDEIRIGNDIGVDYTNTLTCYNPNEAGEACGVCPTCSERIKAFATTGTIDPVKYSRELNWVDIINQFHVHQ